MSKATILAASTLSALCWCESNGGKYLNPTTNKVKKNRRKAKQARKDRRRNRK